MCFVFFPALEFNSLNWTRLFHNPPNAKCLGFQLTSQALDLILHVKGKSPSCSRWLAAMETSPAMPQPFPCLQAGEGRRHSISWVCAQVAGPL